MAANCHNLDVLKLSGRHSLTIDLIRARLQILTMAQLSGTSIAMIEKHYGHLVRDDAEEALASIAI